MIIGPKMLGNATTRLFEGVVAKAMQVPGAAIDYEISLSPDAVMSVLVAWPSTISGYIMAYHEGYLRRKIAGKIKRMPLKYFDPGRMVALTW
jgi:ATP-binding cassette subfamily B protein